MKTLEWVWRISVIVLLIATLIYGCALKKTQRELDERMKRNPFIEHPEDKQ